MIATLLFIFVVALGYVLGSVCSAVIVSNMFSLPDPRITGSQNPGATNVLRLAGKKYAIIVLLGDMVKGLLPVLVAKALNAGPIAISFTCLAAVIGHMYPVFFSFHGGKGVATAIGALLGLNFILGVSVIATWLLVLNFTRYVSLASMVSLMLAPLYSILILERMDIFPPLFFIALFVLYKHRNNINRLLDRKEPKIKFKQSSLPEEINAVIEQGEEQPQITEEKKSLGALPPSDERDKLEKKK
jgi:acyl phosphate:glycerol-3-phosphate acyltransferase